MGYDYEIIYKEYFSKVYLFVLTISHDEHIAESVCLMSRAEGK